ncbi:MAG: hypothetical protein KDD11_23060 [Acidobacteria bacterium]|nr:hypothetical protein [Acidobacteriota bacterium]
MRVPRNMVVVLLALCLLLSGTLRPAEASAGSKVFQELFWPALKSAGKVLASFFAAYEAGKLVDSLTGQDVASQLETTRAELQDFIRSEVSKVSGSVGEEQVLRQKAIDKAEEQLALVDQAHRETLKVLSGDVTGLKLAVDEIRREQHRLELEVEDLDRRMTALEARVDQLGSEIDQLDARVSVLEDALIRDCLDLRFAPRLGSQGFRARESAQSVLSDSYESDVLDLTARAFLNVCTPDLTQRGLFLQFSWITWDLDQDISLYVTFKHIEQGGFDRTNLNHLVRVEYPLYRPLHRVDGQVVELFIPYNEIPFPSTNRLAIALVLTHDGGPIYSLPDRVFNCLFGQQVQCRWGR